MDSSFFRHNICLKDKIYAFTTNSYRNNFNDYSLDEFMNFKFSIKLDSNQTFVKLSVSLESRDLQSNRELTPHFTSHLLLIYAFNQIHMFL